MRIAIIDLGTNTFNLLIARIEKGQSFSIEHSDKISVKLGEGGIQKNTILPEPFNRGIAAFAKHIDTCKLLSVEKIQAFATSAIRSANNGVDFVSQIKEKFTIQIEVIEGDREAELIFEGVRLGVVLSPSNSLIMDIGGGSTEFIIGNKNTILWKQSFNLGAARLLAKFNPHDPIRKEEIQELENYLEEMLQPLFEAVARYGVQELIGSSGSFDTFAEMISHKFYSPINLALQTSFNFKMHDFYTIHKELLLSDKRQRMQTPGIIEMRVDMIVVSAIFTHFILERLKLTQMRLSTYALKEGVIAELMNSLVIN